MDMNLALETANSVGGRAMLLPIKPKYASLILAGTKKVELRRSWPAQRVGVLVLYSSSPVQKLVGLAYVKKVVECELPALWEISMANGGGVTYEEFNAYMQGKRFAFGVMIDRVEVARETLDPWESLDNFAPPQSPSFISSAVFQKILKNMFPPEVPA